jgi:hypothetical protein
MRFLRLDDMLASYTQRGRPVSYYAPISRTQQTIRVSKLCVPIIATLPRQIEKVVDRGEQVDPSFFDIFGHPRVTGVRMTEPAVTIARED